MERRTITAFLVVAILLSLFPFVSTVMTFRLAGVDQGYEPVQPIAFSHRLHAGELEINCLYCHAGAERSRHAGVPALNVCMNCHRYITAPLADVRAEARTAENEGRKPRPVISPEIAKIYRALGLNDKLQRDSAIAAQPVTWTRVHNLPDFAYFDHRPHVGAGVRCQECHGPVESMERVRQFSTLTMGWCVNCHRLTPIPDGPGGKSRTASIDCAVCHH